MNGRTILIVEDNRTVLEMVRDELEHAGHRVLTAVNGRDALSRLDGEQIDLVIADLVMPQMGGIELLGALREGEEAPPVVLMSGVERSAESAVEAVRKGAADYLIKPLKPGEIVFSAERTLRQVDLEEQVRYLSRQVRERHSFGNIVGANHEMRRIFETIEILAETDATVLVTGETGTGKEMVARAIHFNSPRREKRFVTINCGALPVDLLESELFGHEKGSFTGATRTKIGKFEHADGGTVFLDEIGEIPPAIQVKILRVLQEREFERVGSNQIVHADVRIVAATNKDLPEAIERGEFREDLFYRLNVVPLTIPPLRERNEDIPLLVRHFLAKAALKLKRPTPSIAPEALQAIMKYAWPGNVRQLENVIERAVIMSRDSDIRLVSLPDSDNHSSAQHPPAWTNGLLDLPLSAALDGFEQMYLSRVLERCRGSIGETASTAGVNPRTLNRKMNHHGLDKKIFRGRRGA